RFRTQPLRHSGCISYLCLPSLTGALNPGRFGPEPHEGTKMRLFKRWLFAAVLAAGAATAIAAQPPYPVPQPIPAPVPRPSAFDGRWFFRGDPNKPCYVQTVSGPSGPALLFTNENGSQA